VAQKRLIKRTTIIIGEGGEVLEEQDILLDRRNAPMFIKLYPEGYRKFLSIKDADWKVFCACITYMEKDTSRFKLDSEKRTEIADLCRKQKNTVNMSISRLVKERLIIRIARGMYLVNSDIVFNGRESKKISTN
jgi:hypothetical protein